jgi:hypothetical protein
MSTASLFGDVMLRDPSITGPEDAARELAALNLDLSTILSALRRGQYWYDSVNENRPKTAPGFLRWAEINGELRDAYVPLGWTRDDSDNLPRLVSPDGTLSIYAACGNEDTGLPHRVPKTKYPRGSAGSQAVVDNLQASLFPELEQSRPKTTWILLYYHEFNETDGTNVIRSEVSLPDDVDGEGNILRYARRIILPTIDLNTPAAGRNDDEDGDIDIPVELRR